VQPKNVTFPTDAKLLDVAIHHLGKLARSHGVPLRQSYARVAKRAASSSSMPRPCPAIRKTATP